MSQILSTENCDSIVATSGDSHSSIQSCNYSVIPYETASRKCAVDPVENVTHVPVTEFEPSKFISESECTPSQGNRGRPMSTQDIATPESTLVLEAVGRVRRPMGT